MSLATVNELREAVNSGNNAVISAIRHVLNRPFGELYTITDDNLREFLDRTKSMTLHNQHWKGLRPWTVVNVSDRLDADKTWIGIEYETGFATSIDYRLVVNYVWNNFNLTAIDREGCGAFPSEITFSPVHLEDFESDEYSVNKLLGFLDQSNIAQDYSRDWSPQTGIHCNISTPSYRNLAWDEYEWVLEVMRNSVIAMDDDELECVFGRIPYDTFFPRGEGRTKWLEGKLFCTTDDVAVFNGYKKVISRLATCIDLLSTTNLDTSKSVATWSSRDGTMYYAITNMYGFLCGDDDEIELGYTDHRNEELEF